MPVQDLATSEVVTVEPDASASEVAGKLESESVGSVVVEQAGKAMGIITDRDLALRVVSEEEDASAVSAEDVMSDDLLTVDPDDTLVDATRTMQEHAIRRLPVVDGEGDIHGIFTADDMTAILADEQGMIADVLREQADA